jgi:AmmeMemoRadiSam system protein B
VAGSFYPASPDLLRAEVLSLMADATPFSDLVPKALIAPHAGYVYSGGVAADAFATLRDNTKTIKRVVLIGPAHYVPVAGVAVPTIDAFETPLGRVSLDKEAIANLDGVRRTDVPHAPEHALEVELPFLQVLVPSFRLLPLVVGDANPKEIARLLGQLWGGPETLIVVSSDLSHYHPYETARRLDLATAAMIEASDWASIGPNQACGCLAVAGLLIESRRRGLKVQRLSLCNSGDTAGSLDSVVGYGAWMFGQAR